MCSRAPRIWSEHCSDVPTEISSRKLQIGLQPITVQSASSLFIRAATACRFVRDRKRFAAKRLDTILRNDGNPTTTLEKHLDQIYVTVLQISVSADFVVEEKEEHCKMLWYSTSSKVSVRGRFLTKISQNSTLRKL
jgi:hypothetical protein